MLCSIKFSETLQTEILSTETSDYLKQMIILKSCNSVFYLFGVLLERSSQKICDSNAHCQSLDDSHIFISIFCEISIHKSETFACLSF